MNYHSLKRASQDDINQNRKRRRTISNDLFRGFNFNDTDTDSSSPSDLSDLSSTEDEEDSSHLGSHTSNNAIASSNACQRCANCKCHEIPKILEVQSEMLSVLKDIKKQNEDFRKTVLLTMQSSRQEIVDEMKSLKSCFLQMVEMADRRLRKANGDLELMDSTVADDDDDSGDSDSEGKIWFR